MQTQVSSNARVEGAPSSERFIFLDLEKYLKQSGRHRLKSCVIVQIDDANVTRFKHLEQEDSPHVRSPEQSTAELHRTSSGLSVCLHLSDLQVGPIMSAGGIGTSALLC